MRVTVLTLEDAVSGGIHIALGTLAPCVPSGWEHIHRSSLRNGVPLPKCFDLGDKRRNICSYSRDQIHMPGKFSTIELTERYHQAF